jgi:hypothetical protein
MAKEKKAAHSVPCWQGMHRQLLWNAIDFYRLYACSSDPTLFHYTTDPAFCTLKSGKEDNVSVPNDPAAVVQVRATC